jgi:hypothetical protein
MLDKGSMISIKTKQKLGFINFSYKIKYKWKERIKKT